MLGNNKMTGLTRLVVSAHDSEWLRIVMPAYLGGDLSHLLDADGESKPIADEQAQFYAGCIVLALSKLHEMGIAYRDLKPENILLSSTGWPVLSDFGLVAFLKGDVDSKGETAAINNYGDDAIEHTYSMVGTPEFMAPEVVAGTGHDTDVDWWGLGVTVCELLTLNTPFREVGAEEDATNVNTMYANILNSRYTEQWRREHYRRLKPRTQSLIDDLLKVDVAVRLGARRRGVESLRVHPFFWGLSWEGLEHENITPPHAQWIDKRVQQKLEPSKSSFTPPPPVRKRGIKKSMDAATKALDRMFDFSGWGEEL